MYQILSGGTTLASDTIRVLLLIDTYTFDAADNVVNDLTPGTYECTGGSYARQDLGTKAVTEDDGGTRAYFDAANTTFDAVPAQASDIDAAATFEFDTDDATSPVLWYHDWTAITGNGSDITISWHANGIAEIT
jgi:hypothetical protein